jgi:acetyltransferase-like isoleucine patch superfamily enzyme
MSNSFFISTFTAFKKITSLGLDFNFTNRKKICGKGNSLQIMTHGYRLKKVSFEIYGDDNIVIIERGATVSNTKIFIRGSHHRLIIGEDCWIRGGSLWLEDYECQIFIGKRTFIQEAHLAATEPGSTIKIGEDCMLSYGIDIRSGDSHSIIDLVSNTIINYAKNVIIEEHVWIGARVQVLKGVSISSGSIIGAGAVVTKSIPGNSLAVGVPATVKKSNVTWIKERLYRQEGKAIKFKNETAQALYSWGLLLARLGRYEDAIVKYDEALKLKPKPDFSRVWYDRSLAMTELDRHKEAVTNYEKAI